MVFNYFKYEIAESIGDKSLQKTIDYNDIMFNYMQSINADIVIEI